MVLTRRALAFLGIAAGLALAVLGLLAMDRLVSPQTNGEARMAELAGNVLSQVVAGLAVAGGLVLVLASLLRIAPDDTGGDELDDLVRAAGASTADAPLLGDPTPVPWERL